MKPRSLTWEEILWQQHQFVVGTPSLTRLRVALKEAGFPPIRMKLDQDRERLNFWLCRSEEVRWLDKEQTLRQLITLLRASGFDVGFSEVWLDDLNPTSLSGATLVGPVDEVCGQGPPPVEP